MEENQIYPTYAGANVGHPDLAQGSAVFFLSQVRRSRKNVAQQLSAFVRQNAARNQHLVIELGMIQDLQNRADSACLGIGGGVDEPAKPGVDHRPGAHGAGFQRDKKLACPEAIVAQGAASLSEGNDFGMRRRIQVA